MAKIATSVKVYKGSLLPLDCQIYCKVQDETIYPPRKVFEVSVIVKDDRFLLTDEDRRRIADLFVDIISNKTRETEGCQFTLISFPEDSVKY